MRIETDNYNKIRDYAFRIGLDLFGVTKVAPFNFYIEQYNIRKEEGYLSGFENFDEDTLKSPKCLMEDAQSFIAVAMSYNIDYGNEKNYKAFESSEEIQETNSLRCRFSKCSFGIDYHIVIKEKLNILMEFIKEIYPDFRYKIYADTGPFPDKEIAYRCGIGFYGKNNLIINKDFGSFIYIGYALTNIEFPESAYYNYGEKNEASECENCDLCLKACPSNALIDNGKYNAKRCISYNTQRKDDVPTDIAAKMNDYIYGCDICQEVCPYNKKAKKIFHEEFLSDYNHRYPIIKDILNLTNSQFKKEFGRSACFWRGKKIIARNAQIILENKSHK